MMASCQAVMLPLALSLTGRLSCCGRAPATVRAGPAAAAQRPVQRRPGAAAVALQVHDGALRRQQGAPCVFQLDQAGQTALVAGLSAGEGRAVALGGNGGALAAFGAALQVDEGFLDFP